MALPLRGSTTCSGLMTWPRDGPSPSSGFLPVSDPLDTFPEPEQNSPKNMFQARREESDDGKWVQQVARVSLYDKTVMPMSLLHQEGGTGTGQQ